MAEGHTFSPAIDIMVPLTTDSFLFDLLGGKSKGPVLGARAVQPFNLQHDSSLLVYLKVVCDGKAPRGPLSVTNIL